MLQQQGEEFYGSSPQDIAEYLRFTWPNPLADVESVEIAGRSALIVWIDFDAGAAAASVKSDPADVLTFAADGEHRFRPASAKRLICGCGGDLHEMAVGTQRDSAGRPVWYLVGTRCADCGLLNSPVDWNAQPDSAAL